MEMRAQWNKGENELPAVHWVSTPGDGRSCFVCENRKDTAKFLQGVDGVIAMVQIKIQRECRGGENGRESIGGCNR